MKWTIFYEIEVIYHSDANSDRKLKLVIDDNLYLFINSNTCKIIVKKVLLSLQYVATQIK
jgi:hypothetical protein